MSLFIKEIIKNKLNQISSLDLLYYGKQYGFSLTHTEANAITAYIQTNQPDPFDEKDRMVMFQELAEITDEATANKAQQLFQTLIRTYGLGHLF